MPRIVLIVWFALIPLVAAANPLRECAEALGQNPDCALQIAESHYIAPDEAREEAASAAVVLIRAGRIDAARHLAPRLINDPGVSFVDDAILAYYVWNGQFAEATAYVADLPEDSPRWDRLRRTRKSDARASFNRNWVAHAPDAQVLNTLDEIDARISDPLERIRLRASLIPVLARQQHLELAVEELRAYATGWAKAEESGDRAFFRWAYRPFDHAATLVWIALLQNQPAIALELHGRFKGEGEWESELGRHAASLSVTDADMSISPEAAPAILEFADMLESETASDAARTVAAYLYAASGELDAALAIRFRNDANRTMWLQQMAMELAGAGRLEDARQFPVGADIGEKFDQTLETYAIVAATEAGDVARFLQLTEQARSATTRDHARVAAIGILLSNNAADLGTVLDLFHAIEDRPTRLGLVPYIFAWLPAIEREAFLDRARLTSAERVVMRPQLEIQAAIASADWARVERTIDRLGKLERDRLDMNRIVDQCLKAGALSLSLRLAELKKMAPYDREKFEGPIMQVALAGETRRALMLASELPSPEFQTKLAYVVWALEQPATRP